MVIKLKQDKKNLEEKIKKTNNSDQKSEETKMDLLIKENYRLQVRSDMLEEELEKLREIPNKRITRSQLSKI